MMKLYSIYEMMAHHYINRKKVTIPYDISEGKGLLVLATGPSANDYWDSPEVQAKFSDYDVLVMNRTIYKMEEQVFKLKPKYFAVCDPVYWGGSANVGLDPKVLKETKERFSEVIEKVDWDCYLITSIQEQFHIENSHVRMIRINMTVCNDDNNLAYKLYEGNYASPALANVGQFAIYFGITFKYRKVALVGMDFDFFKNLYCDIDCNVGSVYAHQYDKQGSKVISGVLNKKSVGDINGSLIAKYLMTIADTFASFGKMNLYAERVGCEIINYSPESMIDCYEKRSLSS